MRGVSVMDSSVLEASPWRRNVPCFLAAALLAVICPGPRSVSAAECDPHCERRDHPSQYSDPRCESRRTLPSFERDELRCDLREPRRKVVHPAPSVKPPTPLGPVLPIAPAPVTGASDPTRQQPRSVDRDVGFDDALTTQTNPGDGVHGASTDPSRRAPAGRR